MTYERKLIEISDRQRRKRRDERRARGRRRRDQAHRSFFAPLIVAQELARRKPR
jgi:hypothetical protein